MGNETKSFVATRPIVDVGICFPNLCSDYEYQSGLSKLVNNVVAPLDGLGKFSSSLIF